MELETKTRRNAGQLVFVLSAATNFLSGIAAWAPSLTLLLGITLLLSLNMGYYILYSNWDVLKDTKNQRSYLL